MSYTLMRHLRRSALLTKQIRYETTMTNITQEDFAFSPPLGQWSKVIKEAETIVGYPTSFMNLRWLLSDEFANMAVHLRKVVDIHHPLIKTVKTVIYNEQNNLQPWGLVMLLLSKALTGQTLNHQIEEQQRMLAELTEIIRTGHYIHRGLLNIPIEARDKDSDSAMFANKIAILIGDYLLITANGMLAKLRNQDLSYLISTALRDISEGEFFGERDSQNMPLPGKPIRKENDEFVINSDTLPLNVTDTLGSPVKEWTLRTLYNGGTLFGRGCQGELLLGGCNLERQEIAYLFGCHLCLAWQAASELQKVTKKETYSLVSAPVLFALNEKPELYAFIDKCKNDIKDIDFATFSDIILETNAVERTRMLCEDNAKKAISYVEMFGDSECITTIKMLINSNYE